MAFTHIVMFKWRTSQPGAESGREADFSADLADTLRRLVAHFDGVQSYLCGPDVGLSPTNYDFAIVGTFANRESFLAYRDDPEHQRIVTEVILPRAESRTAVQLEA